MHRWRKILTRAAQDTLSVQVRGEIALHYHPPLAITARRRREPWRPSSYLRTTRIGSGSASRATAGNAGSSCTKVPAPSGTAWALELSDIRPLAQGPEQVIQLAPLARGQGLRPGVPAARPKLPHLDLTEGT